MSRLESIVKSIVETNQQFRAANNDRFSKLLDAMQVESRDEFSKQVNEILEGVTSGEDNEVLRDVRGAESSDGSSRGPENEVGGPSAS